MKARRLAVLVVAPHFEPGYLAGGVIRSLTNTIASLPMDFEAHVVTSDRDLGAKVPYEGLSGRTVTWRSSRHRVTYFRRGVSFPIAFPRVVASRRWDIVYVNSLWSFGYGLFPILLWRLGLVRSDQFVIAPRGQLNPGALSFSSRRKRLLMKVYRRLGAPGDWLWHASSELEASHIASKFGKVQTLVSMDPVSPELPVAEPHASSGELLETAFVSRISPKKNLLSVIDALREVQCPVRLTIAGPVDDETYWSRCRQQIGLLPANVVVDYVGPVTHADVSRIFSDSDLFVFPTHGENFGHVIAESLAAACPVVVGPDTPWSAYLVDGAGMTVAPNDPRKLGQALERYAALDHQPRLRNSEAARDAYSKWRLDASKQNVLVLARS